MHHVRQENMPFLVVSHGVCRSGAGRHRCFGVRSMERPVLGRAASDPMTDSTHPRGRGTWPVNGKTFEAEGRIFVIRPAKFTFSRRG